MVRIIILVAAAAAFFSGRGAKAQQHYNFWFRGTLATPLGKKIRIDSEFQHRRQSGFDNNYMLDKSLMFTFRSWLHYEYSKNTKFSLSPFARFAHYKIIQKQTDESVQPATEIRISASADFQQLIFEKFYLTSRNAIEYRILSNPDIDVVRVRNRFGGKYELNDRFKLFFFDELLLNINGAPVSHFFDHNRLGLGLEYHFLPKVKIELGYIGVTRLPLTSTKEVYESNLILNLTYLIKKK